jgi:hypothetical protein
MEEATGKDIWGVLQGERIRTSGGALGPTTLAKSEALHHGSQCCID